MFVRVFTFLSAFLLGLCAARADISIRILDPIIVAKVDLVGQRMHVSVNGKKKHSWKISSGRKGFETPTGSYYPYRMHTMWRSRTYNNAPMPHAVFFHKGYAIHATNATGRLGRPASHGCIRLHPANAKKFFDLVLKHKRSRTEVKLTRVAKKRRYYKNKRKKVRKTRKKRRYRKKRRS